MAVVVTLLSQSAFGSPGEVVCLGGLVAPVGFVSLGGVVPKATEFWFCRAVMAPRTASVTISWLDLATLSAVMVFQCFQLIRREELQVTMAVWVVVYTRHLI